MGPVAEITRIEEDFEIADLLADSWSRSREIVVDRYWSGDAAPIGRQFSCRFLWSASRLYVRFDANQDGPLVISKNPTLTEKTHRLWERDVCEMFLASDKAEPRRYAEFEIAPTGEWLDLMVDWREDEPRDWHYASGMERATQIESGTVTMAIKIPWSAFDRRPNVGDVWLGNLFRQVGSGATRGFLAWSPTKTDEPQFHVPEKFGEFIFVD